MKTVLGVVLAFALALSVMPAGASDTFYAFSTLPAVEQARLTPRPMASSPSSRGRSSKLKASVPSVATWRTSPRLTSITQLSALSGSATAHLCTRATVVINVGHTPHTAAADSRSGGM